MTTRRAILVLLLALAAMNARATISEAIPFDNKVHDAASIILGKCTSQHSQWDAAHKWIVTYSTFRIDKSMKGDPAQEVTIVTPGGVVDGIHQDTIGVPKFSVGDDMVLFVRNTRVGPTVLYFDQGAYEVVTDRGVQVVKPLVSSSVLVDTQRGMAVSPEQPRSLRDFESDVRDSIRRREELDRMMIIKRQRSEQASLINVLHRNRMLIVLALIGAALATWQLVKRW